MLVNKAVSQPLVHTRVSNKANELRHQLREHFPRPEVTQDEHHRNARAKFACHRFNVFDLDVVEDFLWRHLREFRATKQIGPEPPEMSEHELAYFARRLFVRKRNLKVACCETPVFPRERPRANTEEFPESKEERQRQRGNKGQAGAIKEVNDKIEHSGGSASSKTMNAFGERVSPSARQSPPATL
jgi:hypothetical protein